METRQLVNISVVYKFTLFISFFDPGVGLSENLTFFHNLPPYEQQQQQQQQRTFAISTKTLSVLVEYARRA